MLFPPYLAVGDCACMALGGNKAPLCQPGPRDLAPVTSLPLGNLAVTSFILPWVVAVP